MQVGEVDLESGGLAARLWRERRAYNHRLSQSDWQYSSNN